MTFDVGFHLGRTGHPFRHQLPIFNWYYPFDVETDRDPRVLAALDSIEWPSIRRRAAYFHVPFCDTVCSFCPFTRGRYRSQQEIEDYIQALIYEIKLKRPLVGRLKVDCVFIGGGSPSILSTGQILKLGDCLHTYLDLNEIQEFAVELEVKSVTYEKLLAFREIGVNRISFGVQTFSPSYRKAYRLDADLQDIVRIAELANELFLYTNVDMIYGVAGQSIDDVIRDADSAIELATTTIDFYPLNNLAAQSEMYRALREQGFEHCTAAERLEYRKRIARHMLLSGYVRINGYGYGRTKEDASGLIYHSPKFLYHDILYGHHDDVVIGYGASALTQVPGYNFYNAVGRREYGNLVLDRNVLPSMAYRTGQCSEKGLVTFPYRGLLLKSRVPWENVPTESIAALNQLINAGLVIEQEDRFEVTELGWLFYVNLMYFLMPGPGKAWISERIASHIAQGHECEDTKL